jgi:cellulose synthase/poly-beta-1,6-N-acetylglucosamine synthase-like glycosyltransferase
MGHRRRPSRAARADRKVVRGLRVDGDAYRDDGRARLLDRKGWINLPFWGREDARISVIIPVHNASAWLGDCLDALLGQDIPPDDFEVIAVDNLSSDDSMARAEGSVSGCSRKSAPAPM